MDILPAIDLMGGRCVRLLQGQYHRYINYADDPAGQAAEFVSCGAKWLHIIDLDGAKVGKPINTEAVEQIIAKSGYLKIELGGGLRDTQSISQMLEMGIERVIVGTKAVSDFGWLTEIAERFPRRIVLGLDARGSKVATHGWSQDSTKNLIEFARQADALPLAAIIYTDITKDGMLAGPNIERTKLLAESVDVPIIAAGGVSSIADIKKLKQLNIGGAVIGRALYEGTLDLADAIKASQ